MPTSIPHYAWAAAHATNLLCSLHVLAGLLFFTQHPYSYKLAYTGTLAAWGIVVYKALGVPSPSAAYARRLILDENGQYLLLALFFYLQKPVYISVVPFAAFSLFHTLTFARQLLPKPTTTVRNAQGTRTVTSDSVGAQLSKLIQSWVKKNYENAMSFVAFFELAIMGWLLLRAITFRVTFACPVVYAMFLRLRFHLSPQSQKAFGWVSSQIDQANGNPSYPAVLRTALVTGRNLVQKYGQSVALGPPTRAAPQPVPQQRRDD